jgi:hypothetical protein
MQELARDLQDALRVGTISMFTSIAAELDQAIEITVADASPNVASRPWFSKEGAVDERCVGPSRDETRRASRERTSYSV